MKINKKIDYLQFSSERLPQYTIGSPISQKSTMRFYKRMYKFDCGTTAHWDSPSSDKYLVVMSGKACDHHAVSHKRWIINLLEDGAKISRCDFAVTVEGDYLSELKKAINEGSMNSKPFENDTPKVIGRTDDTPETIYIGDMRKRAKKGIFRAYDKALDLGIEDVKMTRFELELKREKAHSNLRRYSEGMDIGDIIRQSVDFPEVKWWVDIMGQRSETLSRMINDEEDSLTDMQKKMSWLVTQVAPSLADVMIYDEINGTENSQLLYDEILRLYAGKARRLGLD